MTTTSITIEFDPDQLRGCTDTRLAMLWHLVQANPADGFRDSRPGDLMARVGWEIIRRWLRDAPVELYHHQQSHYSHRQLGRFAIYRPGAEDFYAGHYEPRAVPDIPELRDALAEKLAELKVWAADLSRVQIAQEPAGIVLPQQAGQEQADEREDPGEAGPAGQAGAAGDRGQSQ